MYNWQFNNSSKKWEHKTVFRRSQNTIIHFQKSNQSSLSKQNFTGKRKSSSKVLITHAIVQMDAQLFKCVVTKMQENPSKVLINQAIVQKSLISKCAITKMQVYASKISTNLVLH
jgi:hypothetical protein